MEKINVKEILIEGARRVRAGEQPATVSQEICNTYKLTWMFVAPNMLDVKMNRVCYEWLK